MSKSYTLAIPGKYSKYLSYVDHSRRDIYENGKLKETSYNDSYHFELGNGIRLDSNADNEGGWIVTIRDGKYKVIFGANHEDGNIWGDLDTAIEISKLKPEKPSDIFDRR